MNAVKPSVFFLLAIAAGCHSGMMAPRPKNHESFLHSFIREDGSTMYFVKKLEWKSTQKDELLIGDITLYTSPAMRDSCLVHLSWVTGTETCSDTAFLQLSPDAPMMVAKIMYSDQLGKHFTHRFELKASTDQISKWLSEPNADIHFMRRHWLLTKFGAKSREAAVEIAIKHWESGN